jgi:hypothetical protein
LTTLEPFCHPNLRQLHVHGNHIRRLDPLLGLAVEELDITDNPVESLGPLIAKPPRVMRFMGTQVPSGELRHAVSRWRSRPELAGHVRQARIMLALRSADPAAELRKLAALHDGHHYLHVPRAALWTEADSMARAWGGYLVTITNAAEERFLASLKPRTEPVWLGALQRDAHPVYANGESAEYLEKANTFRVSGEWTYRGEALPWPHGALSCPVVEWGEPRVPVAADVP